MQRYTDGMANGRWKETGESKSGKVRWQGCVYYLLGHERCTVHHFQHRERKGKNIVKAHVSIMPHCYEAMCNQHTAQNTNAYRYTMLSCFTIMLSHMPQNSRIRRFTNLGWETSKHPPYSSDLSPCNYHVFGLLKETLGGQHFPNDDAVRTFVHNCSEMYPKEF